MNTQLTTEEKQRLENLESIIQKGKDTFVEVGTALAEIRDSRIYRDTHKTFEEYCKERWGMGKSHVNRMMEAAVVVSNLKTSPIGETPKTESQARPLAKLPPEKQPVAWEKAQEKAKQEGKPIAARHVEAAVRESMPSKEPEPLVVDGTKKPSVKIIQSNGMGIVAAAKSVMNRISPDDTERQIALESMIQYCQKRISSNE